MRTQKKLKKSHLSALAFLPALLTSGASLTARAATEEVNNPKPFTALRLGDPFNHKHFDYTSNAGAVGTQVGEVDTPYDVNYLEQFIKADYMQEDLRMVLAIEALAQVERGTAVSDELKKKADPVVAAWKKSACVALSTIQKANLGTVPVGDLCPDTDSATIKDNTSVASTYAQNILALPGITVSESDRAALRQAFTSSDLKPFRDAWAKAYSTMFTTFYWQFFDAAVKDWTWKMVLQEEAVRLKLASPSEKDLAVRFNTMLASTHATGLSLSDAYMLNHPVELSLTFIQKAQYLMAPFELDDQAFAYNLNALKYVEMRERARAEFSQAVISYLVDKSGDSMAMAPYQLRDFDSKAQGLISSKSYADIKAEIAKDAMLKTLVNPGQLTFRKTQVIVDTTQSKPALAQMLLAKLNSDWQSSVQNDINLAVETSGMDQVYIEKQIADSYLKAMQTGYSPGLQNQILLYELALEIKKTHLSLGSSTDKVGVWIKSFAAQITKLDASNGKTIEIDYNDMLNKIASGGDNVLADKAFRNLIEFRALDTHDRMLLEEETRFVAGWKAKDVSQSSTLNVSLDAIAQDFTALQANSTLKFKVKTGADETAVLMGQDPFIEGLAVKIFANRDWKPAADLKNLVAIHYDSTLKDGVYIFVVERVGASQIASAFDKQDQIGQIYSNQSYAAGFKKLQDRLLQNYVVEIQTHDGKLLQSDSPELKSYLTN